MPRRRSRLLHSLLEKDDEGPSVKGILDSVRDRSKIGQEPLEPSLEDQRQMLWGTDYRPGESRTGYKHGM